MAREKNDKSRQDTNQKLPGIVTYRTCKIFLELTFRKKVLGAETETYFYIFINSPNS